MPWRGQSLLCSLPRRCRRRQAHRMSGMWWRRKARPCWATVRVRRCTSLQETTRKAAGRTRRCRATATRNGRAGIRPARVNSPGVAAPLRFFRRRAVLNLGSRMLCPQCAGNDWQRRIVTGSGALTVCHPRPDVDRSHAADCQGDSPPPRATQSAGRADTTATVCAIIMPGYGGCSARRYGRPRWCWTGETHISRIMYFMLNTWKIRHKLADYSMVYRNSRRRPPTVI
jgi:hypothetical protein